MSKISTSVYVTGYIYICPSHQSWFQFLVGISAELSRVISFFYPRQFLSKKKKKKGKVWKKCLRFLKCFLYGCLPMRILNLYRYWWKVQKFWFSVSWELFIVNEIYLFQIDNLQVLRQTYTTRGSWTNTTIISSANCHDYLRPCIFRLQIPKYVRHENRCSSRQHHRQCQ